VFLKAVLLCAGGGPDTRTLSSRSDFRLSKRTQRYCGILICSLAPPPQAAWARFVGHEDIVMRNLECPSLEGWRRSAPQFYDTNVDA